MKTINDFENYVSELSVDEMLLINGGSAESNAMGRELGKTIRTAFENASLAIGAVAWFILG